MKSLLAVLPVIILLSGCSSLPREVKNIASEFQHLQADKDGLTSLPLSDYDENCFGISPSEDLSVIYLLNSQCSICYGKLFRLLDLLSCARIPVPVHIILRKGDVDNFTFFNEERINARGIVDDNLTLIPVDSYYPYLNKYIQGDGFVLYMNKIIATIKVEDSVSIIKYTL